LPITLIVRSALGGEYWCAISLIDGTAIATSTSTGSSVQTISMTVLWWVRDGVGLLRGAVAHDHPEQQHQHEAPRSPTSSARGCNCASARLRADLGFLRLKADLIGRHSDARRRHHMHDVGRLGGGRRRSGCCDSGCRSRCYGGHGRLRHGTGCGKSRAYCEDGTPDRFEHSESPLAGFTDTLGTAPPPMSGGVFGPSQHRISAKCKQLKA
jgi:hypothetical protein